MKYELKNFRPYEKMLTCLRNWMCISVVIFVVPFSGLAQKRKYNGRVSDMAYEFGMGSSVLLGDLGGADAVGSHGLKDIDPEAMKYSFDLGVILKSSAMLSYRINGQYALLHGSDSYTQEYFRKKRNLSVNTHIFSFRPMFELKMPLSKRSMGRSRSFICLSAGAGVVFFQPTARVNGKNYALQPLGTEGQFVRSPEDPYKRIVLNIPFGVSYGYKLSKSMSLFLDLSANRTFTDYLDDVSRKYESNEAIRNRNGEIAAFLADPNTAEIKRVAGVERGNASQADNYFTFGLRFRYQRPSNRLF